MASVISTLSDKKWKLVSTWSFKRVDKKSERKIKIKCTNCGHIHTLFYNDFKRYGISCPDCAPRWTTEQKLFDLLLEEGFKLKKQKTFDGCVYKEKLRFDMATKVNDGWLLIEYDGEHHSKLVNWSGKMTIEEMEYNLKEYKIKDKIKNVFAANSDEVAELIRIDYTHKLILDVHAKAIKSYSESILKNKVFRRRV